MPDTAASEERARAPTLRARGAFRPFFEPHTHTSVPLLVLFNEEDAGVFESAAQVDEGATMGLACTALEVNDRAEANMRCAREVLPGPADQRSCSATLCRRNSTFILQESSFHVYYSGAF
jgi:hypothetical protein